MGFGECAAGQCSAALRPVLQGNPKGRTYPGAASAKTMTQHILNGGSRADADLEYVPPSLATT